MKNINLNLYKTFYEVAKYGSISEAAKQTFSSQPAISRSIKKLEEELDVQLFYRTLQGVELTEKGKELLFFVEQSYNNLVTAERHMLETNNLQRGRLSIGMPSNIGSFFLFDKIIDFHQRYPNIEITIVTGSTSKLMDLLQTHTVDFVIDTAPIHIQDKNVVMRTLETVKYCFIANKYTKNKNIDKITSLKDLEDEPLILPIPSTANRNDLDLLCLENKVHFKNILNVHTSEMIISFVKKDLGIGYVIANLVCNEADRKEIQVLDIQQDLPKVTIHLIYNPTYLTKAPQEFIKEYIQDIP